MEQSLNNEEASFIPQEVVELVIRRNMPLVKAWRLHKGLTVEEVASASDLKTYEVNQLESGDNTISFHLEKIARGMELDIEQLVD